MWILALGLAFLLVPGALAFRRAGPEFKSEGRISSTTFVLAFLAYAGHGAVTVTSAWLSKWPIPLAGNGLRIGGAVLLALGGVIYLTARLSFRSFRLAWGLNTGRLVTSGIYRLSRNPQCVGWLLVLAGSALAGQSWVALLLALAYWLSTLVWIPREERVLKHRFGEEYRHYCAETPRYIGLPRPMKKAA